MVFNFTIGSEQRIVFHVAIQFSHSLFNAILCLWLSVGTFTSVANPIAWRNLTMYQVKSSCHHSRPCLAEYSKAWWLLCQPSPKASTATHLINFTPYLRITNLWTQINYKTMKKLKGWDTNCFWISPLCSRADSPIHGKLSLQAKLCGRPKQFSLPAFHYKKVSIGIGLQIW